MHDNESVPAVAREWVGGRAGGCWLWYWLRGETKRGARTNDCQLSLVGAGAVVVRHRCGLPVLTRVLRLVNLDVPFMCSMQQRGPREAVAGRRAGIDVAMAGVDVAGVAVVGVVVLA